MTLHTAHLHAHCSPTCTLLSYMHTAQLHAHCSATCTLLSYMHTAQLPTSLTLLHPRMFSWCSRSC
eukprot:CAMPEP_0202920050 /NCGR_PEP_ID=MMETSP1392-20130828/76652_1 /ASSEMBLY_ACC=CAM_ASM_000868 /TAXON_ID=225041 /ORGANISM="Chlamydomonas chlamydogama, Strain SAG 11-48b" /LENGTH=65 /DNA_ID=CAMNT_0049613529 /DNA_START=730 /DNA_END=927 /DNA_ORIENTATION=-